MADQRHHHPGEELFLEERRQRIIDLLRESGKVQVHTLSWELGVSEVTIRNDLNELASEGLLTRTHGGAILTPQSRHIVPIRQRHREALAEKRRIAAAALAMIDEGDTITLDAGSTTFQIAAGLVERTGLTVVTNDLDIAQLLVAAAGVELIVVGGIQRTEAGPLVGPIATRTFKSLMVDKAFVSTTAFSVTAGLMTTEVDEAEARALMLEHARQRIAVLDSRKFTLTAMALVAPVTELHVVITDDGVRDSDRRELEERGLRVVVV